ncbi:MAG: AAA family ATPase [Candidatus Bilamarchaeaceae archaeon]
MITQKSLLTQKVETYLILAKESERFWHFLGVFLAALLMLSTIKFYPLFIVFLLAAICGAIAYFKPPLATIASFIFAFPAVVYQSAAFGWIFALILAIVLFEAFENWTIITVLQILVMAPFAFDRLPVFGWMSIFCMLAFSFHFGSKRSALISIPAVLSILLMSTLLSTENSAFMPINLRLYAPYSEFMFKKNAVEIENLSSELLKAIDRFFNAQNMGSVFLAINLIATNIFTILFVDSGLVQLLGWTTVLFLAPYLSARLKNRPQLFSSLSLLILIPVYYFAGMISGTGLHLGFVAAVIFSIALFGLMEHIGWRITRETELQRAEKVKEYGKFGFKDVGAVATETLADIGGYEKIKQELKDAIMLPLERQEIAHAYGMKPPSGILLFGPPGTGKTALMRALARELKYNFIEVKCSQILSQWYGESEKNIAEVFATARKTAPTILFFDEIDTIGKKRAVAATDEVTPRVLSAMLQEMDGAVKSKASVIVVGTTNIPNQLDPALLRPGRFDKIIYMPLPDFEGRKAIFKVLTRKLPLDPDVDFDLLAKKTERFSGADIKNIITEAKNAAAKEAASKGVIVPIGMRHILPLLKFVKPSTTLEQLAEYEKFKMDFERSIAAKEKKPEIEEVKWSDVVGMENIKQTLLETIQLPLLHEDLMKQFNIRPSKGILLFGPPGTGKTLIVRAAANELNASFQALSGADLMKRGYFYATNVIKEAFNRARENAPSIIFIDEIETFLPARGASSSEMVGQFLAEMDGIKELKGVVVIAATNRPDLLDPAILRPGRFDKIFYIPPPDEKSRAEIFRLNLGEFAKGIDLEKLAKLTNGFSGADIAAICRDVKMMALREKLTGREPKITTVMIEEIIMQRRPSITPMMLKLYEAFIEKYGERK